jgi:CRISPR/Cas system-associated exonuclease Cas4 (RecB family)
MEKRCLSDRQLQDDGFDVDSVITTQYIKENEKPWSRKTGRYHPSAMGGCTRAIYYDRIGEAPVPRIEHRLRALFALGHAVHDSVQASLAEIPGFEAEVPSYDENLRLYGHCDGIFREEDWILELKTIGDASFKTLVKPKQDHVMQLHCYMWCNDIPRGQVLYINRNTGARRLFKVQFDANIWKTIMDKIEYVESCVSNNSPPPQEVSSYSCGSCKFYDTCGPELKQRY